MSTREEMWTTRLRAAVDDHPGSFAFDVPSYVAAGRKRVRRKRVAAVVGTVAAASVIAVLVGVAGSATRGENPQPIAPIPAPGANGWVALDAYQGKDRGSEIYLVREGQEARRLEVTRSAAASDACPVWSPDGRRLLFGRLTGSSDTTSGGAELVIVPVSPGGTAGDPTMVPLDGFDAPQGFEPHPCATWAPDGRWVALRGPGDVWVVDTQTDAIRRLPGLRPIDLEWRPGTDELTIAGDMGATRAADWQSTPVTVYSVSTDELHQLGSVEAGDLTWSPDGSTLAYQDGVGGRVSLRLVDPDGTNQRLLVDGLFPAVHGIGPVWSPTGDRIAYQIRYDGSAEGSEVVLVSVADGTQTVIEPPRTEGPDGPMWYPFTVTWSPDGTTLLYTAWAGEDDGLIAVPADRPSDVTVLTDLSAVAGYKDHQWVRLQMWGRQPR